MFLKCSLYEQIQTCGIVSKKPIDFLRGCAILESSQKSLSAHSTKRALRGYEIMILSQKEVDERLSSPENLINKIEIRPLRERVVHHEVPDLVRGLIGNLANREESNKVVAEVFSVSRPQVSGYSRGLVGQRLDEELLEMSEAGEESNRKNTQTKAETAHGLALDNLIDTLQILKPKLVADIELKPSTLSKIASDMAKISKALTPEDKGSTFINNTQVILYKPELKPEAAYETIEG